MRGSIKPFKIIKRSRTGNFWKQLTTPLTDSFVQELFISLCAGLGPAVS